MNKLLLGFVVLLVVVWALTWIVFKVASGLVHLILLLAVGLIGLAFVTRALPRRG
jgi:hypothetical protein